jgi:hypothetical protein
MVTTDASRMRLLTAEWRDPDDVFAFQFRERRLAVWGQSLSDPFGQIGGQLAGAQILDVNTQKSRIVAKRRQDATHNSARFPMPPSHESTEFCDIKIDAVEWKTVYATDLCLNSSAPTAEPSKRRDNSARPSELEEAGHARATAEQIDKALDEICTEFIGADKNAPNVKQIHKLAREKLGLIRLSASNNKIDERYSAERFHKLRGEPGYRNKRKLS